MYFDQQSGDRVERLCAELQRRTINLAAAGGAQPAAALAIRYQRIVSGWWRHTRVLMPDRRIPKSLGTSAAAIAACVDGPPWPVIADAAHALLAAQPDALDATTDALLTAIGVDLDTSPSVEALRDWELLTIELHGVDDPSAADLMYRLARFTMAVIADGETPAAERTQLTKMALAAIAREADQRSTGGHPAWDGLRLANDPLDGDDDVTRAARLSLAIDDLADAMAVLP